MPARCFRLALVCAALFACGRPDAFRTASAAPVELRSGWSADFGDGARPWTLGQAMPDRRARDRLTLRVRLPAASFRDPALFVQGVDTRFSAFVDGKPVGASRAGLTGPLGAWTLLPLPLDAAGRELTLEVVSHNPLDIGPWGHVLVGSAADLVLGMLEADAPVVFSALFSISVAVVAFALWLRRRVERSYLLFAVWALSRGLVSLAFADTRLLLWNAPDAWQRLLPLCRVIGALSLFALACELFPAGRRARRSLAAVSIAGAVAAAALVIDQQHAYWLLFPVINVLWMVTQVAVLYLGLRASRGDAGARLFTAGYLVSLVLSVWDSLAAQHVARLVPLLGQASDLVIILSLAAVVLGRIAGVFDALRSHAGALAETNAQLQRTETMLTAAVRTRDDFIAVAAHELRSPLTAVTLQIELLLRKQPHEPHLVALDRHAHRLSKLIDNLLDLARVSERGITVRLEEVDLSAVLREAAAHAGQPVEVHAPAELRGCWDRLRLEQVVENLIGNAVKYGQGKPIEARLEERDGRALLTVRDHGIGIPAADQARIFDRFERAVSARNYSGLGLGLWITREIVARLGGTISVRSTPGEGAAFIVTLPRQLAAETSAAAPSAAAGASRR